MFRIGIVEQQDLDGSGNVQSARVRVKFPDRNQLQSWWLPVGQRGSQDDKLFWLPDIGEQVVCQMDEHDEDGAVLYTLGSTVDQPPPNMTIDKRHASLKDGAIFEYDRNLHVLTISIPMDPNNNGTINITVSGGNCNITADGNVNVTANNSSINLSAPNGDITFVTDEHKDSVNGMIDTYNSHTHTSVDSNGDSATSNPPGQQMT